MAFWSYNFFMKLFLLSKKGEKLEESGINNGIQDMQKVNLLKFKSNHQEQLYDNYG